MEVLIRPFRPEDLDGLFVLDYRCYTAPYRFGYSQLLSTLRQPQVSAVVIEGERKGDIVGGLIVRGEQEAGQEAGQAAVISLMVEADFRRYGLGSRLLRWAMEHARGSGWAAVVVPLERENAEAAAFLAANGFEDTGSAQPYFTAPEVGTLWRAHLTEAGAP